MNPVKKILLGFAKESIAYLSFPFFHKNTPYEKFIIFSLPRSGSTLLVSLLDSHSQINCKGELLYYPLFFPNAYLRCHESSSRKPFYGFKLLPTHFEIQKKLEPSIFMEELNQLGYKMIKLSRQNLLRAALSSLYAEFLGRYHYQEGDSTFAFPKMDVNRDELLKKISRFQHLSKMHDELSSSYPHLDVNYEDDLMHQSAQQSTVEKICQYLGLESEKVTTDYIKVTTEQLSDFINNEEELLDMMQDIDVNNQSD